MTWLNILKKDKNSYLTPISNRFLNKRYLGINEYLQKKVDQKTSNVNL